MAAQVVAMSNFEQAMRFVSFQDDREPWRWSNEPHQRDEAKRMGTLAALKVRETILTMKRSRKRLAFCWEWHSAWERRSRAQQDG